MPTTTPRGALDALYREVFERGVRYCLPDASLKRTGLVEPPAARLTIETLATGVVRLSWLGVAYQLRHPDRSLTESEVRLLQSIGRVLAARYHVLLDSAIAAEGLDLFRGVPEDRFVSAALDPGPYTRGDGIGRDRVAEAIEVLRISSSTTYENRRINTGVLLFGSMPDPCHTPPPLPDGALPYDPALTAFRTFHRLSDGMRTVALVDGAGRMVELVDIEEWAKPFEGMALPAPCADQFEPHCRATLCGGHICLVLTRNGEIKAFADGMQMFTLLDGRWRLSDLGEKYSLWRRAIDRPALAERLFSTALNLAERRRGGLFVVLDSRDAADLLVPVNDRLEVMRPYNGEDPRSKNQFHYLLRGKSVLDLTPAVLESIARIDGAIVLDQASNLMAFGAILKHHVEADVDRYAAEGGRTTAAIVASRYGQVLKVSEDGLVGFYSAGRCIWEL
jgi:hypothetical protein